MKSIITIVVFVSVTLTTTAQWQEVNSPTSNSITDIHMVDSENGFMSCSSGTVLKTTNRGLDWQAFDTGIKASFMSIFGIDKDTVYTARVSLYKSTNSCASWVDVGGFGSSGSTIFDICFSSPKTGFILKSGKLYKTNDCGLNWYEVSTFYTSGKIIFTSQDTGYVAGGSMDDCDPGPCNFPFNHGAIIKTTDGGENWQKLNFFNDTLNIISASFVNNNFGYCFSSNNTIQKTEDGGLTWISINTGIAGNVSGGLFINEDIGFIITFGGQIYITKDSGMNWDLEYTAEDEGFFQIDNSDKMVVAGGSNGLICVKNLDSITNNKENKYFNPKETFIYPNPAKNILTIHGTNNHTVQYQLALRDIKGQEILSENIVFNNFYNLDLKHIKSGMYFLTLVNDNEQVVKKIVIQK